MSLSDLTSSEAVHETIAEYDRMGRARFLDHYGFKPAKAFYINHDGKYYDSKAVAGVAVGKQHPHLGTLTWDKFSGGEDTVKVKLEELGFVVEKRAKIPL